MNEHLPVRRANYLAHLNTVQPPNEIIMLMEAGEMPTNGITISQT